MPGLLDFLGLGQQGQISRGPDGQNYQYAETTGMAGDNGGQGWIRTNQQPRGGMFSGRMAALNDPAIALPLAGALMQPGDIGSNLGQGFALAGQGVATRKKLAREQAVENATAKYLEAQGADTGLVELAKSGAGGEALQLFTQMKKRNDLMTVGKNIYDPNTGQWIAAPAGMGGDDNEYYGNPMYTQDEAGNTVAYQLSKNGTPKRIDIPGGSKIATGVEKVDAGTYWILKDRKTGNNIGTEPKNLADAERQKELGAAQGKNEAAATGDAQAAQNALDLIQDIRTDPNRARGTGKTSIFNSLPGTGGYDFQQKVEQAKSGAFLTAIQQMRGLGALSNAEGGAATAAVTRMNTATTEEGFEAALNDYEKIVRQGLERAKSRLPQAQPSIQPPAPQSGGVVDYRDFFGGQ